MEDGDIGLDVGVVRITGNKGWSGIGGLVLVVFGPSFLNDDSVLVARSQLSEFYRFPIRYVQASTDPLVVVLLAKFLSCVASRVDVRFHGLVNLGATVGFSSFGEGLMAQSGLGLCGQLGNEINYVLFVTQFVAVVFVMLLNVGTIGV